MSNARRRKQKANVSADSNPDSALSKEKLDNKPPASPSVFRNYRVLLAFTAVCASLVLVVISIWDGHGILWLSSSDVGARTRGDKHVSPQSQSPFFVADLPGRGKGLLASRNIKQGELLLREKPLFVVPRQISSSPAALITGLLAKLGKAEQGAFYNLSYVNFPKHLDPDKHQDQVALAIFQTNAVAAGDGVGIFPRMARINHGCASAFNAVYTWREKEKTLYVHALKDIKQGEELLTSYTNSKRARQDRRSFLAEHYGFECRCRVCSLPETESRASDKRLEAISEAYDRFAGWGEDRISGADAIAQAREIWKLGEEEGYWSERGRLAADAAWVAASHSDATATREWARIAVVWYSYEVGIDSEQVEEMRGIALSPEGHPAWNTRKRLEVGGLDRP